MKPVIGKQMPRFSKLRDYLKKKDSAPTGLGGLTEQAADIAPKGVLDEDDNIKSKGFKMKKNPFAKN